MTSDFTIPPTLRASYAACRRVNAHYGRTFFLATRMLPAKRRPHVHALYAFARFADEVVDDTTSPLSIAEKGARLDDWAAALTGSSTPFDRLGLMPAIRHTANSLKIDPQHFVDFMTSMRMDLDVCEYATAADLDRYVWGSAAVIGLQLLPVLGHPAHPRDVVAPYAAELGIAFQLANFVRDVGEDLRRGRLYFPLEHLAACGVTRDALEAGVVDARVRELFQLEIAIARDHFRAADPGIDLVDRSSRDCLRAARILYSEILDAVEAADYKVLDQRVSVGGWRRASVALPALVRATAARRSRRPSHTQIDSVDRDSANPNSRSSNGAKATRTPRIAESE